MRATTARPKPAFRDISGILLLDKPQGLSSNQALQRVRHLFAARKAGHTGSLDPMATGLLPVCFGEATKIAGYLLGSRKAYDAQLRLGTTTDSDDADGATLLTRPVPMLSDAMIEAAMAPLRGHIVQTPPAYSAIKQAGVPLYKRARRGEDVQVPSREVDVHRLELLVNEGEYLRFQVECGSGTYVRSLARDLGERLGCGAHLSALRRTWVDPFVRPQMHTLEELGLNLAEGGQAAIDRHLLPLEQGLSALPAALLDAAQAQRLRQGQPLTLEAAAPSVLSRALDDRGRLIALIAVGDGGRVTVQRGFNASAS
jgi:tRNA pseudouridine55 synthase